MPGASGSESAVNKLQTWKEWESVRRRRTKDTRYSTAAGLNRLHSAYVSISSSGYGGQENQCPPALLCRL